MHAFLSCQPARWGASRSHSRIAPQPAPPEQQQDAQAQPEPDELQREIRQQCAHWELSQEKLNREGHHPLEGQELGQPLHRRGKEGQGSQLTLQRGLNGLWTNGGLMYAIPFR